MRRLKNVFCFVAVCFVVGFCQHANGQFLEALEFHRSIEQSVFRVRFGSSSGTAFNVGTIGNRTYAITAKHCVCDESKNRFGIIEKRCFRDGFGEFTRQGTFQPSFDVRVEWKHDKQDVAIISYVTRKDSRKAFAIGNCEMDQQCFLVFAGFPGGNCLSVSAGRQTNRSSFFGSSTNAPSSGYSGGPVISSSGVIGCIVAYRDDLIGLYVDAKYFRDWRSKVSRETSK